MLKLGQSLPNYTQIFVLEAQLYELKFSYKGETHKHFIDGVKAFYEATKTVFPNLKLVM